MHEFLTAVDFRRPRKGAEVEAWHLLLLKIDSDPAKWEASIEALFTRLDRDGSGEVDVHELGAPLRDLGVSLSNDQLTALIEEIDSDFNGSISLAEFKAAVAKRKPHRSSGKGPGSVEEAYRLILKTIEDDQKSWERSIVNIFHTFDRDGSGAIDISELESGLMSLGVRMAPDQVMALRDDLDANKDGKITMTEFTDAVERNLTTKGLLSSQDDTGLEDAWTAIMQVAATANWPSSIETLFATFDKDGSGEIDISELSAGLKAMDPLGVDLSPAQAKAFRDDIDADFNGTISLQEFKTAVEFRKPKKGAEVEVWHTILLKVDDNPEQWERSVERLFKKMDIDGSGEIDVVEVGLALKKLGIHMSDDMLKTFVGEIDDDFNVTCRTHFFLSSSLSCPFAKQLMTSPSSHNRAKLTDGGDRVISKRTSVHWHPCRVRPTPLTTGFFTLRSVIFFFFFAGLDQLWRVQGRGCAPEAPQGERRHRRVRRHRVARHPASGGGQPEVVGAPNRPHVPQHGSRRLRCPTSLGLPFAIEGTHFLFFVVQPC
jgi:Ca2+-binding EF-hand superfamily protein